MANKSNKEENIELPVLYSMSGHDKIKQWSINVVKDPKSPALVKIITNHGYLGGKIVENTREITKGKNIGRANETTPFTQAVSEAKSKWNKKKDEGYQENKPVIGGPGKNNTSVGNLKNETVLPMLALSYEKRSHDVSFPCFVQPKLDGIRALYYNGSMWSRKGKEFLFLDNIKKEILEKVPKGIVLDGEIYSDKLSFQELTGLVRKKKLNKEDLVNMKKVKWVIYDYVSQDDYKSRHAFLTELFSSKKFENVELLKTEICNTRGEIEKFLKKYESQGYEGLIVRNFLGPYKVNHRSKNLQKLKSFMDDEFEIVDFTEGTGVEKGLVIWICETKKGQRFSVRPHGTHEERAKLYKNARKYIGQMLTVRYQELTDDGAGGGGIPRFGVGLISPGITVRNYE
jgi:DNA ligase-1